ncbi:CSC1-like protein 1 [Megalops cyprinoides]|uniref:CSC1-like protein 1 n=1 Tax=Megalops cyprinoides TaxID=118141 RepID=UPI001863B81D|nr:CSC1-like protein 1 [Megalops cyprinoides]
MGSPWWERFPLLSDNGTVRKDNSCFSATEESTVLGGVSFGGVPVVLLLDFIVFLVLLGLFTCIRRKLWDYGRLALVAENNGFNGNSHHRYDRMSSYLSSAEEHEYERGFCSWLPFVIRMDEEMVKDRCGSDAVHYLSFQRHLIVLMVIICVSSMAIILPVNLSGNLLGNDPYSFGRTTIGNLQKDDKLMWLHTVFAVLYLILTVAVLRHHTSQMKDIHTDTDRRTLFVCSIPKDASEESIKVHFNEAYPTCRVSEVRLCYDVAKLIYLVKERNRAEKNLLYYRKVFDRHGKREVINPRPCGHLCCCDVQGCERVDAIDYYSAQEVALQEEVKKQMAEVPQRRLGMAFVTLHSEAMAAYILKDFNALDCAGGAGGVSSGGLSGGCGCGREPQPSSESQALRVSRWRVGYAPHPSNIYWENLSLQGFRWWLRCLLLNFCLFVLLFFLTTPSIIISTMDKFNVTKPIHYLNSAVISQFFPTVLLWSFSALLPTIVYYSTLGESHWTRSSENRSMMHKLYIFLLFMVLILPSLGLTSLDVFFRWLFDTKFLSDGKLRFECVFLPDQGAFFVNYVIAAALVGSGMELLRLPGLLLYTVRMALARSAAERKYVKQSQAYEFEYGAMYGWTLCVFTVIMAYSITCPVIVPFGLLYVMLKHLVDKHNLYFAYLPARLDRQVHLSAVNQALAAPIICLLWLYFFSVIRTGFTTDTSLFTFIILCVTVAIGISYTCFGHFKYLSPHNYNVKEDSSEEVDGVESVESSAAYLPAVLQSSSPTASPSQSRQDQSYGTLETTPPSLQFTGVEPGGSPVEQDQ